MSNYNLITADPPWRYSNSNLNGSAARHYPTMSPAELQALPVAQLAADNAVLLMWGTGPLLPQAVELVSAWGFEGQTTIPWIKVASSYQGPVADAPPAYGTGFWVRGCTEYFIVATRGEVELPEHPGALVAHRTRHSAKPEAMQDWAEACWPQFTRRLEMFARRPRAGWHAFGNEGIGTDRLEAGA
jgi:N6-adenosine-specific RNA methylase IME4